jgi:hypothetical protein
MQGVVQLMMADVIIVQLISSMAMLLGLYVHRLHGSKENKQITTLVNGQRTAMIEKIEELESRISKLVIENSKLADRLDKALQLKP